eukprot:2338688-Pleurochrysis_carterae.AAC.2
MLMPAILPRLAISHKRCLKYWRPLHSEPFLRNGACYGSRNGALFPPVCEHAFHPFMSGTLCPARAHQSSLTAPPRPASSASQARNLVPGDTQ